VYDEAVFTSIVKAVPELANQTVILNGVAKTYAMTGWRVGWMIAPSDVVQAATTLQSHATSNVNNIAQKAALEAVAGPLDAVNDMLKAFDDRRKTMVKMLNEIDGFHCPTPKGAFYAYVDVTRAVGKEIIRSEEHTSELQSRFDLVCRLLLEKKK